MMPNMFRPLIHSLDRGRASGVKRVNDGPLAYNLSRCSKPSGIPACNLINFLFCALLRHG